MYMSHDFIFQGSHLILKTGKGVGMRLKRDYMEELSQLCNNCYNLIGHFRYIETPQNFKKLQTPKVSSLILVTLASLKYSSCQRKLFPT